MPISLQNPVDTKLHDLFLRHQVHLIGYENGVARRAAKIWIDGAEQASKIIVASWPRSNPNWPRRPLRYSTVDLRRTLAQLTWELAVETDTELGMALADQAITETNIVARLLWNAFPLAIWHDHELHTLSEAAGPISPQLLKPIDVRRAHRLVRAPIHGKAWPARVKGLNRAVAMRLRTELALGMSQGESIPTISRRVRNTFKAVGGRRAVAIARTEVHNVSSRVHDEMYRRNRSVMKGVEYLSTLDARTCPVCGSYDGNAYYFEGEGRPVYGSRPFIPQHPLCRCVYVPISRFADIFGFKIKPVQRAARAGPVTGRQTFGGWLRTQDKDTVEDILGIRKAAMFRSGRMALRDFVAGSQERTLTELEGLAAKGAPKGPPSRKRPKRSVEEEEA